jgi:UDP-N-acetylmuramoyl-tripeptide--D-alanyl-D-alanine ligase
MGSAAGRDAAVDWLRHNVSAADVVLVKASRGAALELIAEQLLLPEDEGSRTR